MARWNRGDALTSLGARIKSKRPGGPGEEGVCTSEEVQAFRAEKEAKAVAEARAQKREPGQLSIQEAVKRLRE